MIKNDQEKLEKGQRASRALFVFYFLGGNRYSFLDAGILLGDIRLVWKREGIKAKFWMAKYRDQCTSDGNPQVRSWRMFQFIDKVCASTAIA